MYDLERWRFSSLEAREWRYRRGSHMLNDPIGDVQTDVEDHRMTLERSLILVNCSLLENEQVNKIFKRTYMVVSLGSHWTEQ